MILFSSVLFCLLFGRSRGRIKSKDIIQVRYDHFVSLSFCDVKLKVDEGFRIVFY